GRGPKLTCLATCPYASLPSSPPVFSAGIASSGTCGGAAAVPGEAALTAPTAGAPGLLGSSAPLALHPAAATMQAARPSSTTCLPRADCDGCDARFSAEILVRMFSPLFPQRAAVPAGSPQSRKRQRRRNTRQSLPPSPAASSRHPEWA